MRDFLDDLRHAVRVLRRTPTLTAVAVLTLALGIATTTTVFGWIDGMVLHPLRGARDDGQLAVLEATRASGINDDNVSYADCRDFEGAYEAFPDWCCTRRLPLPSAEGRKPIPRG